MAKDLTAATDKSLEASQMNTSLQRGVRTDGNDAFDERTKIAQGILKLHHQV